MRMLEPGQYRHRDYLISRGGYVDTCDDRCDGWYVDADDADTWDRRGPGYMSLRDARGAIDWMVKEG